MKIDVKALVAGILFALGIAAVVWAATTNQIWNNVYDSSTQSVRIEQVTGS